MRNRRAAIFSQGHQNIEIMPYYGIICFMSELNESLPRPTPREVLESFLQGVSVGSPKWLRMADENAWLHVQARIERMSRDNPKDCLGSVQMHRAIAEEAQIGETMRNRSMGLDAVAYNRVEGLREVYNAYYGAHQFIDPRLQVVLVAETNQGIADAILSDMQSIMADRAG